MTIPRTNYKPLLLAFALAWLIGVIAHAGTGASRLVAKVAPTLQPPSSLTVTSPVPVLFQSSYDLITFNALTVDGVPTNRLTVTIDKPQMFFRGKVVTWPLTNYVVVFSWKSSPLAASSRIYIGSSPSNYLQVIETANRTQLTFRIWNCWSNNYASMTSVGTNGDESAHSPAVQFTPQIRLTATK